MATQAAPSLKYDVGSRCRGIALSILALLAIFIVIALL